MNSYKNISLWENTQRLRVLGEFRNDVVNYFNNSRYTETVGSRTENAEAVQARERINHTVLQAKRIIEAAGIPQTATWTPPRRSMEYKQQIHLIFNLFEFDSYQIPPQNAIDLIERAIGFYESDSRAAFFRTINPFWWLWRGFLWFTRIPFVFLGAVGFDAGRAEGSTLGKFFKAIFALVSVTAGVLTILNYLGWLPAARALLGIE